MCCDGVASANGALGQTAAFGGQAVAADHSGSLSAVTASPPAPVVLCRCVVRRRLHRRSTPLLLLSVAS